MIKINLTPVEELEIPYWWVPDAIILAALVLVTFGGVYIYMDMTRNEIAKLRLSQSMALNEVEVLRPDMERYDSLSEKVNNLESKKNSLLRITESKMIRYLPLILLENLQTLKPEGLWFRQVGFVEPENNVDGAANPADVRPTGTNLAEVQGQEFPVQIELIGNAFENTIIAEFMTVLKATQSQAFERSDVRTQLFFSNVQLSFAEITAAPAEGEGKSTLEFRLVLNFRERSQSTGDQDARLTRFIRDFQKNGQATMRY
ncbi:MAG: hypothetical protein ACOH5I_16370 [Oligoflexus sp.]